MINVNDVCTDIDILNVISILKTVVNLICLVVPVILVIILSIDIIKTISSSEVETKKLYNTIIKRVFAAIIIFLIPTLIKLALSIIPMDTSYYLACYSNASKSQIAYIAENNAVLKMNELTVAISKNDYKEAYRLYEEARVAVKKIPDKELRQQKQDVLKEYKKLVEQLEKGQDVSKSVDRNEGDDQTDASPNKYTYKYIEKMLKKYDIDEDRKQIVLTAASYVGKIPYYWGGKASSPNFDSNRFGSLATADKKGRTAKGLDCSHFVDFVFWQVMNDNLGNSNTRYIWDNRSQEVAEEHLLPGDIAFKNHPSADSNHVAIYAGTDDNDNKVWIHLTGNPINNVVINNIELKHYRRVDLFVEDF